MCYISWISKGNICPQQEAIWQYDIVIRGHSAKRIHKIKTPNTVTLKQLLIKLFKLTSRRHS